MATKTLVAYFSASGVTAKAAKQLAAAADADLYEIRPAVPYTDADLNWRNSRSRSSVEMNDLTSRPALADADAGIAGYDTIFLGFPIWWGWRRRSSAPSWSSMIFPARKSCFSPPPAAAALAGQPRCSRGRSHRTQSL